MSAIKDDGLPDYIYEDPYAGDFKSPTALFNLQTSSESCKHEKTA